jgi:hypothetical protein
LPLVASVGAGLLSVGMGAVMQKDPDRGSGPQPSGLHQDRREQFLGASCGNQKVHRHDHDRHQSGTDYKLDQKILHGSLLRQALTRGSGRSPADLLPPASRIPDAARTCGTPWPWSLRSARDTCRQTESAGEGR